MAQRTPETLEEREFMRSTEAQASGQFGRTNRLYKVYDDGSVLLNYDDVDTKLTVRADRYEFDGPVVRFYRDGEEIGLMRFKSGADVAHGDRPQTSWLRINGPDCISYDTELESGFGYWLWNALKDAKDELTGGDD